MQGRAMLCRQLGGSDLDSRAQIENLFDGGLLSGNCMLEDLSDSFVIDSANPW